MKWSALGVPSVGCLGLAVMTTSCRLPDEPVFSADQIGDEVHAVAGGQLLLIGGTWGQAHGVNDRGDVVGQSCTQGCLARAFYWSETGGLEDLGTLPGYTRSVAYSITDNGTVFGTLQCPAGDAACGGEYAEAAVRWDRVAGAWTITTLQGCKGFNLRNGPVNNNEQCVGRLAGSSHVQVQTLSGGTVVSSEPLPKLDPIGSEFVSALSDAPMVAGQASLAGTTYPVVWYRDLPGEWRIMTLDLPGAESFGMASDISEPDAAGRVHVSGRTAGPTASGYRAARWTLDPDGQGGWRVSSAQLLPNAVSGRHVDAWAPAINSVGAAAGHSGALPVLWPNDGGVLTLPLPSGPKASGKAIDLNDHGLVVGTVWDQRNNCNRAAVWRLQ